MKRPLQVNMLGILRKRFRNECVFDNQKGRVYHVRIEESVDQISYKRTAILPTIPAKRTPATPKKLESTDLKPAEAGADDEAAAEAAEALVRAVVAADEEAPELEARLDAEVADEVAAEDDPVAEGVLTAPEETTWSWGRSTTRLSAMLIPSSGQDQY